MPGFLQWDPVTSQCVFPEASAEQRCQCRVLYLGCDFREQEHRGGGRNGTGDREGKAASKNVPVSKSLPRGSGAATCGEILIVSAEHATRPPLPPSRSGMLTDRHHCPQDTPRLGAPHTRDQSPVLRMPAASGRCSWSFTDTTAFVLHSLLQIQHPI